jgi:threonine-phosphate decarboxylase
MIKGHGSDLYKYKKEVIADFSSNVWYEGMPSKLIEHLETKLKDIVHYPEPDAGSLAKKIAELHKLEDCNVLVTNGATEAFYLLAQVFSNKNSYIVYPSFAEYEDACKTFNHKLQYININDLNINISLKSNSILWLGNPNNPDGKITSKSTIERLLVKNPDTIFIIDEAYNELCNKSESVLSLLSRFSNLVIVHSLTKSFVIPGIRLGYILSSKKTIDKLISIKMPWSVNSLAIEAGNFIIEDYHNLLPNKKILVDESKAFQDAFESITGLQIKKSECNYFLVKLNNGKASDLKEYLLENYGLLIRDASNFKGLNESYFRIATQGYDKDKLLFEAINQWIKLNK